jgi:cell division protein FtsW
MPRRLVPDRWLFAAALVLVSIGVVMVYSASAIVAADRFGDSYHFLKRQVLWAVLGLGGLWVAFATEYRRLERLAMPLLAAAAVLLVLVLVPPFGHEINGTRRWLRLGVISLQPVEPAKFAFVVFAAAFLARAGAEIQDFRRRVAVVLAVAGALAALVLRQPDLGNSVTFVALGFVLLFLAGVRAFHLLCAALPAIPLLVLAVWIAPYRVQRILTFVDPWRDPLGAGFQSIQSMYAIASGGLVGRGLGESKQKLFYLPEPHTDFVFSVIGEEAGLLGSIAVVLLFGVLVWRGLRAGLRAPDAFGACLALGLTTLLAMGAIVNLGVATGVLPTKGLPLPYVSFGGSALVVTMVATGVLLNISQYGTASAFAASVAPAAGRVTHGRARSMSGWAAR